MPGKARPEKSKEPRQEALASEPETESPKERHHAERSTLVLAVTEEAADQLRKKPGRLAELIQQGLLFTVSSQTEMTVEEVRNGLAKVRIGGEGEAVRSGWIRASQVSNK